MITKKRSVFNLNQLHTSASNTVRLITLSTHLTPSHIHSLGEIVNATCTFITFEKIFTSKYLCTARTSHGTELRAPQRKT